MDEDSQGANSATVEGEKWAEAEKEVEQRAGESSEVAMWGWEAARREEKKVPANSARAAAGDSAQAGAGLAAVGEAARGFEAVVKRAAVDVDSAAVSWDWENWEVVKAVGEC